MLRLTASEAHKKRLDGMVSSILFTAVSLIAAFGALAFLTTRSHMFHVAYSKRRQHVENSWWLLEQCKTSDFYSNMKHHSTLCDDIALAHTDAIWLHALCDVIDQTHVCGELSCMQNMQAFVLWILGRGLISVTVISLCLLLVFVLTLHFHRWLWSQRVYNAQLQFAASHRQFPVYPLLEGEHETAWRK
jgi:hypothetical protein